MTAAELAVLRAAEQAISVGMFGPVPVELAGAYHRVLMGWSDEVCREYVVFENDAVAVFVYETPSDDGDIGRFDVQFSIELSTDISRRTATPELAHDIAGMLRAGSDALVELRARGVGIAR